MEGRYTGKEKRSGKERDRVNQGEWEGERQC